MAIKDFRAKRARVSKIIGSGSATKGTPSLVIYSASVATNFAGGQLGGPLLMTASAGFDTEIFFSGAVGSKAAWTAGLGSAFGEGGTSIFGGDLVVSGGLYDGAGTKFEHDVDFTDGGGKLYTTSSVSIDTDGKYVDGLLVSTFPVRPNMADAFFFVSGARDSRGGTIRGTSVFGGDVVVSGTLYAEKQVIEVDENVTGSLFVSGALFVSRSATIAGFSTVGEYPGVALHLPYTTRDDYPGKPIVIAIGSAANPSVLKQVEDAGTTYKDFQVLTQQDLILSGGRNIRLITGDSAPLVGINDIYLSGNVLASHPGGAKPVLTVDDRGTAITSGPYFEISGSDGTPFARITGVSTLDGVLIAEFGVDATGIVGTHESDTAFFGGGVFTNVAIRSNGRDRLIITSGTSWGSNDSRCLILSGGARLSPSEHLYQDLNFFVSGSRNTKGGTTQGTAVFGGDLVVSGTLHGGSPLLIGIDARLSGTYASTQYFNFGGPQPDGTPNPDGTTGYGFRSNAGTMEFKNSGGAWIVFGGGGGSGEDADWVDGDNKLKTTSSVSIDSSNRYVDDASLGANTYFFVSGGIGGAREGYTHGRSVSAFGGDIVTSGSVRLAVKSIGPHVGIVDQKVLILSGGAKLSPDEATGGDVSFYVSGAVGSREGTDAGSVLFGGDVTVSGSLLVSGSVASVFERGAVYNRSRGAQNTQTFIVFGWEPSREIITVVPDHPSHGSEPMVLIMSGGLSTGQHANQFNYKDTAFFVSGAIASKDSITNRGTALFGGDVHVSGNLSVTGFISGGLWTDGGSYYHTTFANRSVYVGGDSNSSAKITLGGVDGGAQFNKQQSSTGNFRVSTDSKVHAILAHANLNKVLILSGGSGQSPNEALANDVSFYVSGSSYAKNSNTGGVSVIGGDLVVSGTLYADRQVIEVDESVTGSLWVSGSLVVSQSATIKESVFVADEVIHLGDVDTKISFADNQVSMSAGGWSFMEAGDFGGVIKQVVFNDTGTSHNFVVNSVGRTGIKVASTANRVLILSGGNAQSVDEASQSDVSFYVSGSRTGKGSNLKGMSVFGGDVEVSGTLYIEPIDGSLGEKNSKVYVSNSGNLIVSASEEIYMYPGGNDVIVTGSGHTALWVVTPSVADYNPAIKFSVDSLGSLAWSMGVDDSDSDKFKIHPGAFDGQDQFVLKDGGGSLAAGDIAVGIGALDPTFRLHVASDDGTATIDIAERVGTAFGPTLRFEKSRTGGIANADDEAGNILFHPHQGTDFQSQAASIRAYVDGLPDGTNVPGRLVFATTPHASGEAAARQRMIISGSGLILILSGTDSAVESRRGHGTDTNFYVSGAIGSMDTAISGTSVFGGDIHVSGNLNVGGTIAGDGNWTDGGLFLYPTEKEHVVLQNTGTPSLATADTLLGADGSGLFNANQNNLDFVVSSSNRTALRIDGTLDRVLILSGGNALSSNESTGTDVAFYVSGTLGSQGEAVRGTALFGGDIAVSGTLVANRSDEGAHPAVKIDKNYTGTTTVGDFINDASGLLVDYDVIGIVQGGQTAVHDAIAINFNQDTPTHVGTLNSTGLDLRMTGGTSGTQTMKGVAIKLAGADTNIGLDVEVPNGETHFIARSSTSILDYFTISVAANAATTLATSDNGGTSGDITIVANGKAIIDSTEDQVLILSGGSGKSTDEADGADVAFYVSGSRGLRGVAQRGTAVFGGDVVHSGSVVILDPGGTDENLKLVRGASGNNYITFEENNGANIGQIYANSANLFIKGSTTANDVVFRVGSQNVLRMDGATERIGIGSDVSAPQAILHVSGSESHPGSALRVDGGGPGYSKWNLMIASGSQVMFLSGGSGQSIDESQGMDVAFYVSGSRGTRGIGAVRPVLGGTSVFGGDVVISGSLHGGSPLQIGSYRTDLGNDVALWVDGVPGSRNAETEGVALFGGDVVMSGALYVHGAETGTPGEESAAITLNSGTESKIVWDQPGNTDPANVDAMIYESGGDLWLSASDKVEVDARSAIELLGRGTNGSGAGVQIQASTADIYLSASDDIHIIAEGDDINVWAGDAFKVHQSYGSAGSGNFVSFYGQPGYNVFDNILDVGDDGITVNDDGRSNYDFRAETDNLAGAVLSDAGADQVILGSDGITASVAAGNGLPVGSDCTVYLSGTINSRTVPGGGTTIVAGDLYVSGAIYESQFCAISTRNANIGTATTGIFAAWANASYPLSNPGFAPAFPASGLTLTTSGQITIDSPIQATRHMLYCYTLILDASDNGPCTLSIKQTGTGGTIIHEAIVAVSTNNTTTHSFQVIIPPVHDKPILCVNGGGLAIQIHPGSTVTCRSIT